MKRTNKTATTRAENDANAYVERVIATMKEHGASPKVSRDAQERAADQVAKAFRGLVRS